MTITTIQLTERQKLTIEHLWKSNIKTPTQIIEWCESRLSMTRGNFLKPHRRHSKEYFKQIIEFYKNK